MNGMTMERMSRAEAIGVLARMATERGRTLEEVRALQVGVRSVAKRMFDQARCFARKGEAKGEARQDAASPSDGREA